MSETFLEKILAATREKIAGRRKRTGLDELSEKAAAFRAARKVHLFHQAIAQSDRTNIIAEIKRASPSKGTINAGIDVAETAKRYQQGGACAISVLTEENFFNGSIDDLRAVREAVDLPILRKDFIVDEFQIFEAAVAGADAVLLIVAALSIENLEKFLSLVETTLQMDALVEVHTLSELEVAKRIGAKIIGVNNRDLRTFEVSLDVSRELIRHRFDGALIIAESGISSRDQIAELRALGFDGFLVGESLMRSGDPEMLLEELSVTAL